MIQDSKKDRSKSQSNDQNGFINLVNSQTDKRFQMKAIWKKYVLTGEIGPEKVRAEVLDSWKRCKEKRIYAFHKTCPKVLSSDELNLRIQQNIDLLDVARPVVNNIYKFVSKTGFVVMICDKDGYVLERVGDEEDLASLDQADFREGACCAEDVLGTNAIGTCLILGRPIQVQSYEHWSSSVHIGTCSAAPIRDPQTNEIIGALDMTGPWDKIHPHTLGMVVAGAGAIESLIESRENHKKVLLADQNKALILDSTTAGLITIDNKGNIAHINGRAMKYLGLNENPTGQNVHTVFKANDNSRKIYKEFLRWVESDEKISDEFITVHLPYGSYKCLGSAHSVLEKEKKIGRLIILQDISRINKLVKKVVSKQATATFKDLKSNNILYLESIETAQHASKADTNILILGESGTGKELFAQAIHNASERANKPFVAINCGAIPRDLLSSELFGYVSGAFTGAQKGGAEGKFEVADGGTIFLDEIGDMPLEMQAALLRVIQEKVIMRVGGSKTIPVDVRIIAATNKDLSQEVRLKNFRFDLFYRLNVICIKLPALRDRREDIPMLVENIVAKIADKLGKKIDNIENDFLECCLSYDWPGNIRELQNIIERAIILTKNNALSFNSFPSHLLQEKGNKSFIHSHSFESRSNILKESNLSSERSIILKHLEDCKNNKSIVAKKLGVSRTTLYRKLKELNLSEWLS